MAKRKSSSSSSSLKSKSKSTTTKASKPREETRKRRTRVSVKDERSDLYDDVSEETPTLDDIEKLEMEAAELDEDEPEELEVVPAAAAVAVEEGSGSGSKRVTRKVVMKKEEEEDDSDDCKFVGEMVPDHEARSRWPHRYVVKKPHGKNVNISENDDEYIPAKCHYLMAEVDGHSFELGNFAHVWSGDDTPPHICKIVEIFAGIDGRSYFRARWFYRPNDTLIKDVFKFRETKRIFSSEMEDDNPLGCLVNLVNIVRVKPNLDLTAKESAIPECDYYYDMKYLEPFSTYIVPEEETVVDKVDSPSSSSSDVENLKIGNGDSNQVAESKQSELSLLDLYSGCGAMSTGLCLGANLRGTKLITKWAIDFNESACESLKLNHPHTEVRNEEVGDFLALLKEWKKICGSYRLIKTDETHEVIDAMEAEEEDDSALEDSVPEDEADEDEGNKESPFAEKDYEVERIIGIQYGDVNSNKKVGLYFKVQWKGYGPEYDTWEPVDGLGNCWKGIGDFVKNGFKEKVLPLPGDCDVICGGPPCQGLSGFNRFRDRENPLNDPKNQQLLVYMDVVEYLKPRYLLMENVVDLVKFCDGHCGRYSVGRLVDMNYQARLGLMAAGAYGLPQFRMRCFLFGARPSEKLAQFPLPTHDVVYRGVTPNEFHRSSVTYSGGQNPQLQEKLLLGDAISDLPPVDNYETRDEIPYVDPPATEFQRFIRLTKDAMLGSGNEQLKTVYDHRPLRLNIDDYHRVCRVPKKKGANFRDFPGVRLTADKKKVEWDPTVDREYLPSGKPLVPDYAMSFVKGTSTKPFGRKWFDETVPTVVTRAEPHNQAVCHPFQDRVLTIRENARLQGFPDYYKLTGPVKQRFVFLHSFYQLYPSISPKELSNIRKQSKKLKSLTITVMNWYMQVGNAVAVPVARALGFALALASDGHINDDPVFTLPAGFPVLHPAIPQPAAAPVGGIGEIEDNPNI